MLERIDCPPPLYSFPFAEGTVHSETLIRGFDWKQCVQQPYMYSYPCARLLKPSRNLLAFWQFVTSDGLEGRSNRMGDLFVFKLLNSRFIALRIVIRLVGKMTGSPVCPYLITLFQDVLLEEIDRCTLHKCDWSAHGETFAHPCPAYPP